MSDTTHDKTTDIIHGEEENMSGVRKETRDATAKEQSSPPETKVLPRTIPYRSEPSACKRMGKCIKTHRLKIISFLKLYSLPHKVY